MLLGYDEYKLITGDQRGRFEAITALQAASDIVEKRLRRRIERSRYTDTRYFDHPTDRMHLRAYPVDEVESIVGAEIRHLDAVNGIARFKEPVTGEVACTYTGGYRHPPEAIRTACALIAMGILSGIENEGKEVVSERLGDYQTTYSTERESGPGRISPAAEALLEPYRGIV